VPAAIQATGCAEAAPVVVKAIALASVADQRACCAIEVSLRTQDIA